MATTQYWSLFAVALLLVGLLLNSSNAYTSPSKIGESVQNENQRAASFNQPSLLSRRLFNTPLGPLKSSPQEDSSNEKFPTAPQVLQDPPPSSTDAAPQKYKEISLLKQVDSTGVDPSHVTPTVKELLRFIFPAVAMLMAGPIMSIVDTAVVGRQDSLALGALAPATQLCDMTLYMLSFLAVAANNLVAGARARGDAEEVEGTVSAAFGLAALLGAGAALGLTAAGPALARLLVDRQSLEVLPLACTFIRYRVLSYACVVATMVGQGTALALKDSLIPLKVVLMNGLLNLAGDIILVVKLGMGIGGAAIATAASEVAGTYVMVSSVSKRINPFRTAPLLKIPTKEEFNKLMRVGLPVLVTLGMRAWVFAALGKLVSSAGPAALGAWQVMFRLMLLFCMFGDSFSQAAQAFLPTYNIKAATDIVAQETKKRVIGKILKIAAAFGAMNSFVTFLIPLKLPFLFTQDPLVITEMLKMAPFVSAHLFVHAFALTLEGVLISNKDFKFLAGQYGVIGAVMLGYIFVASRWAALSGNVIAAAWGGLFSYTSMRLAIFSGRIWQQNHKLEANLQAMKHPLPVAL